jgi:secondary thiamine-phosphate synthase enzyme
MNFVSKQLKIKTSGKGLYEFTDEVKKFVQEQKMNEGLCTLFIQHTSASLVVSENADPTAKLDLESYLEKIAPENQSWHKHTLEGSDDSPSHMRSILTDVNLSIPIISGKLVLGTWQGIYVFEHRSQSHLRKIILQILKN